MIDHISFAVSDFAAGRAFYDAVLAPLGYARVINLEFEGKSYGADKPVFWIYGGYGRAAPGTGAHTAFASPSRNAVDEFHKTALARGGRDEGAPGLRPEHHANYYGAFVFDPDGHKLEAVCHAPGAFMDQFKST